MDRASWFTILKLLAMSCLVFGCTEPGLDIADDSNPDVDDPAGKADGVIRPLGTYVSHGLYSDEGYLDDGYVKLTLKSDKTFRREAELDPGMDPYVIRGTYKYTKSGSTRYLRLLDESGNTMRYAYVLEGKVLALRLARDVLWESYELSQEGACDVPADCGLQGLVSQCEVDWGCEKSVCQQDCQAPAECPDPDPPEGSVVTCHMIQFLQEGNLADSQIIQDAKDLLAENAQDNLQERGFVLEKQDADQTIYVLGNAQLHMNGQRALFLSSGSVTLATFAVNSVNAAGFIEIIELDVQGDLVKHTLNRVD